jgi:hypothetical protein
MGELRPGKKEIMPLPVASGMISDVTSYSSGGRWRFGDGVRFRKGAPEKIGGWSRAFPTSLFGTPSTMFAWSSLDTKKRMAIGTDQRAYTVDLSTQAVVDVSPVLAPTTLGSNPLSFTSGSPVCRVTHTSHGMTTGRYVRISGASAAAGITAPQLTGEFVITVITVNTYDITLPANATSTTTGGGASVQVIYLVDAFLNSLGAGWGQGGWGLGPWGQSPVLTFATPEPRHWYFDAWGEDLVMTARGGAAYYYDVSTPTVPAVNITSLAGASDVPGGMIQFIVEPELRFALALGCVPIGGTNIDPMFIRWADRGTVNNWTPAPTSTAGGFRLSKGSRILRGISTKRDILVFTDTALYALQAVGGTSIFRPALVSANMSLAGPLAVETDKNEVVRWMGQDGFYQYDGRVSVVDCDVSDYVFNDINTGRLSQVVCGMSPAFDEMWWFYPSQNSAVNDRYVIYNYADNSWSYGSAVKRSAWLSTPLLQNPVGADTTGVYYHETGYADGSTVPPQGYASYIRSGPVEVDAGNFVVYVDELYPDLSFGKTPDALGPEVSFKVIAADWAGGSDQQMQERIATALGATDAQGFRPFTEKLDLDVRGRRFAMEVDCGQANVFWRLGTMRVRVKLDGQR